MSGCATSLLFSTRKRRAETGAVALAVIVFHIQMTPALLAQGMTSVRPFIGLTHAFDSNVLSSSTSSASDFVTRISPGLEGEYGLPVARFLGRYTIDLETFARLPAMNTAGGRHAAFATIRNTRTRRVSASIDGSFVKTHTPSELSNIVGVVLGRAAAERLIVHPAVARQMGRLTSGRIEYTFTREILSGGVRTDAHTAAIGLDRQLSRRAVVSAGYEVRQMVFRPGGEPTSHVLRAGWTRPMTRAIDVAVQGGASVTNGTPSPDFQASVQHKTRPTDLAFAYTRTQATIIGLAGVVDSRTLTAAASLRHKTGITFRVAPSVSEMTHKTNRASAWRLAFDAEGRARRQFLLRLSYEASSQGGALFGMASGGSVSRHLVQIAVVPITTRLN